MGFVNVKFLKDFYGYSPIEMKYRKINSGAVFPVLDLGDKWQIGSNYVPSHYAIITDEPLSNPDVTYGNIDDVKILTDYQSIVLAANESGIIKVNTYFRGNEVTFRKSKDRALFIKLQTLNFDTDIRVLVNALGSAYSRSPLFFMDNTGLFNGEPLTEFLSIKTIDFEEINTTYDDGTEKVDTLHIHLSD